MKKKLEIDPFHARRRALGHRPALPHPHAADLHRRARVQQTLQAQGIEAAERGRHSRGAAADRPGDVRCGAGASKGAQPKVAPPRVVTGPTLLTGICFCGHCDGAMTIRTGKSGRYRYDACSIKARQGETGCVGQAIPMDKLDTLVAGYIEDRLLAPERLAEVLASVIDRRQDHAERRREHIAELNKRAAEAELRLKRLHGRDRGGRGRSWTIRRSRTA
ncbi:MAG: zinc ribbon domain-containing protein [Methylacidiphilaceae bacterium]|nr:zinc ribbon domain-containing protein [Candidatus Methylacidiphilaceae bacterium]